MLTTLCIEHFAIVEHLELDFTEGMTTFTGETGAGKSIMIDALMLALGGRAEACFIRPGRDKCDISAGFCFSPDSEPALWLLEHDIPYTGEEVYLRRVIYVEGRSKSYINGRPFPLQKIKELAERLVHIHGQHQHQTLMQHPTHRQQLDQYALSRDPSHQDLLQETMQCYKQYQKLKQERDQLQDQEKHHEKIQLIQFQLEELSTLGIQEGETHALNQEHQRLHHTKEYIECSLQITRLLNGEEQPTVCFGLHQIMQLIRQLPQEEVRIKNAQELLNEALIQSEEALAEIQQFAESLLMDPDRLSQVESRIGAIHHLARKYHIDSLQLSNHAQTLSAQLKVLQDSESQLKNLQLQLELCTQAYQVAAAALRASRLKQAKQLEKEITSIIQQLGMPRGWVEIHLSPLESLQAHGLDKVEYKVCTNPGMPVDSLSKIASGGELSRIGLAIQMITAHSTPTVLFDEVDVGISGVTAALVGNMLRKLGERLQVFCVTHQPQVAACAHHHFLVEKQSDRELTLSTITQLNASEKIDEIARMLGGLRVTDQSRSHAQELLLHCED